MNSNELKIMLKPLVKQLVKETMQEELTTVISEIIKHTAVNQIVERKQFQESTIDENIKNQRLIEKEKVQVERKKMLEDYSNVEGALRYHY